MQIAPGGMAGVRSPITYGDAELSLERPAPKLGEHQGAGFGDGG
jgi:hypothetical protein